MTALVTLAAVRRSTPSRWSRGGAAALGAALALALAAAPAAAQAPQGPPPPPAPQGSGSPPPDRRPPTAPPPPAAAPAAARAPSATPQPSVTPLLPPPRASALPPDSVRQAAAAGPVVPPAGAVARCRDGTFIVAPSDASACSTHRGVGVVFPQRSAPPRPAARPVPVAQVAAPSDAPPSGATMRCKDGTWLAGAPAEGRCEGHGGTAVVLPAPRPAPPTPRPRRP